MVNHLYKFLSSYTIILFCFVLLSTAPVWAEETEFKLDLSDSYKQQRSLFIKAEYALDKKQEKTYQRYYKQLDGYPLQIYLKYREYRKKLVYKTEQQIFTFLKELEETPYEARLRTAWLNLKAKNKQWQPYINAYTPQTDTARQCHYLNALIQTGKQEKAFEKVTELWLVGNSQPKSCDPVFNAFKKAGKITPQLLWDRISLAMQKGRTSLAGYLARSLPKNDQLWVKEWIVIYKKPGSALKSKLLTGQHPMKSTILVQAIERRVRKNPTAAINLFESLDKKYTFSEQEYSQIYRAIGMKFAYRHKPDAWLWLDKISDEQSDIKVQQWRVRSAIREGNWSAISSAIERLPLEEKNKSTWQYWQASELAQQGKKAEAQKQFSQLSTERGYYNFLAADKMEMPYEFKNIPLNPDQKTLQRVANYPGIQRAREFYLLDKKLEARREWYHVTRKIMDENDRAVAAKIAQQWGWNNRAIITIGKTNTRDDLELRFPLAQKDRIVKYSKQQHLKPAYTMAVIRRESAFATDARSRVGALGLMQIMPATGREIARKLKVKHTNKNQLLKPETNINFGTKYLNMMLSEFYSQPALASAAYNAGGHRVKAWLPRGTDMHADQWIESIPFTETRRYVRSILAYTAIYEYRLDIPQTRLQDNMPKVPKKNNKKN